jgi:hypothetical protein
VHLGAFRGKDGQAHIHLIFKIANTWPPSFQKDTIYMQAITELITKTLICSLRQSRGPSIWKHCI